MDATKCILPLNITHFIAYINTVATKNVMFGDKLYLLIKTDSGFYRSYLPGNFRNHSSSVLCELHCPVRHIQHHLRTVMM